MAEKTLPISKIYKIDASGQILGRVASQAAVILRGKNLPNFARHLTPASRLEIVNASKLKISAAKLAAKTYAQYSGYPGGLKYPTLAAKITKKGYAEPLRLAIYGMLPKNKLRAILMTKLKIYE